MIRLFLINKTRKIMNESLQIKNCIVIDHDLPILL